MSDASVRPDGRNGLLDFLAVVRRFWVVGLVVLVATLVAAGAYVVMASPSYSSTSRLLVGPPQSSAGSTSGVMLAQQRAVTYAQLVTSPEVTGPVSQAPGVSESPESLASELSATPVTGTSILEITGSGGTEAEARAVTQAATTALTDFSEQTEQRTVPADARSTFVVIEQPSTPTAAAWPQPGRAMAAALVLGLLLASGVMLLLQSLRPSPGARRRV